jgi:hypothetical protein
MTLYSNKQMAIIDQVAATLPVEVRSQFHAFVSNQLDDAPLDDAVEAAICAALRHVMALPHTTIRRPTNASLLTTTSLMKTACCATARPIASH